MRRSSKSVAIGVVMHQNGRWHGESKVKQYNEYWWKMMDSDIADTGYLSSFAETYVRRSCKAPCGHHPSPHRHSRRVRWLGAQVEIPCLPPCLYVLTISLHRNLLNSAAVLKAEGFLVLGILSYVLWWYIGSSINASKAKKWYVPAF